LFRKVNREWGTTFLIVTHDQEIASMTDRILEIADGRLSQDVPNDYARTSRGHAERRTPDVGPTAETEADAR
jgi:ABC-type lipoprotein export system ATPase subunit